jgi:hypothetical protein
MYTIPDIPQANTFFFSLVNPRARCAHNVTQSTATLEELREKLRDWPSMLPQCLSTKRENSMPAVHNNGEH